MSLQVRRLVGRATPIQTLVDFVNFILADHQLLHFEDVLRSRKDVSIYHKLAIGINQLATSARNLAGNAEVGVERTVVVV